MNCAAWFGPNRGAFGLFSGFPSIPQESELARRTKTTTDNHDEGSDQLSQIIERSQIQSRALPESVALFKVRHGPLHLRFGTGDSKKKGVATALRWFRLIGT